MVRKARIKDIKAMQSLINGFAKQDLMLPRSLNELYENIRDYWVYGNAKGISGCCALHVSWGDLAEIKALAVESNKQEKGIGRQLVLACLKEAQELGAKKVFVLTYRPDYFRKLGFRKIDYSDLPHKIWAECINCPKFPDCEETALIKKL